LKNRKTLSAASLRRAKLAVLALPFKEMAAISSEEVIPEVRTLLLLCLLMRLSEKKNSPV